MNKAGMLARMAGGFVIILIGITLIPVIIKQVEVASTTIAMSNVTDYGTMTFGATVLKIVPFLFALAILGVGIAVAWGALRGRAEEEEYVNPFNILHEPKEIKPTKHIINKEYKKVFTEEEGKFD